MVAGSTLITPWGQGQGEGRGGEQQGREGGGWGQLMAAA